MGEIGGAVSKKQASTGMDESLSFQDSSFLASASYNPNAYQLTVNFKSGSQLIYRQVFPATWDAWKLHPSKGSFYANFIKAKTPGTEIQKPLKVSDFTKAKEGKNKWQKRSA